MTMNRLLLTKDLYHIVPINEAISSFRNICEVSLSENTKYYICSFDRCSYNPDITTQEFENYVIDLMNSHKKSKYDNP